LCVFFVRFSREEGRAKGARGAGGDRRVQRGLSPSHGDRGVYHMLVQHPFPKSGSNNSARRAGSMNCCGPDGAVAYCATCDTSFVSHTSAMLHDLVPLTVALYGAVSVIGCCAHTHPDTLRHLAYTRTRALTTPACCVLSAYLWTPSDEHIRT
jgi:hypothetical protein